jgi:hypothetical protein
MGKHDICRLCGEKKELQYSHVIPAFVYKWLKKTSGTGYLRFGMKPNKRAQDGLKFYWLCRNCEQKFCEWETAFSNKIFYPINQNTSANVQYTNWFLLFCVSVSWRVLTFYIEEGHLKNFTSEQIEVTKKTLQTWKEFLLGIRPHPDIYEQHFIPFDAIASHTMDQREMPANINRYILRAIDVDIVRGKRTAFTYTKMGRFIVIGFIIPPERRFWKNTKVHLNYGRITPTQYTLPTEFADYFFDKAKRSGAIFDELSTSQLVKIDKEFTKNIDRFANSESMVAMKHDVRMFGKAAFRKSSKE